MEKLHPELRAITRCVALWVVHFVVIYAAISAACAPRALIDHATLQMIGAGATLIAVLGAMIPVIRPFRRDDGLKTATWWTGALTAMAILFTAAPLPFFSSCGG